MPIYKLWCIVDGSEPVKSLIDSGFSTILIEGSLVTSLGLDRRTFRVPQKAFAATEDQIISTKWVNLHIYTPEISGILCGEEARHFWRTISSR